MRELAALALLCLASQVAALEVRDGRGFDVAIESVAEPIEVDGVPLSIRRATGSDVPRLASRIVARWRAAGSMVQEASQQGWQMSSRWDDGHMELLQWRGEGAAAELLYSRLDARRKARRAGGPPLRLPAGCVWGRQIAGLAGGKRYQQHTARCRRAAAALLPELRELLGQRGWRWRETTAGAFQINGSDAQGMLLLAPGPSAGESWIAWIGDLPVQP